MSEQLHLTTHQTYWAITGTICMGSGSFWVRHGVGEGSVRVCLSVHIGLSWVMVSIVRYESDSPIVVR